VIGPKEKTFKCTAHNSHKRQIPIFLAGFESAIPANERPQTNALDRAATGIGTENINRLALEMDI
jgi:hypothetical protein